VTYRALVERRAFDSIPAVHEWNNVTGARHGVANFVGNSVHPEVLLAASYLLWPTFVEVAGCVVRADCDGAANVDAWLSSLDGDVARTEAVVNHLHLWDVFAQYEDSKALLSELADVLVDLWDAALRRAFPQRTFEVVRDDHYGPGLTFSSVAEALS
jgi:hypothetical protein